ncbi:MAG TPA: hypothetical protein VF173_03580 [Thermoanaerobaculia bacterium]|nr:hypothetical protein [Thermoanaerobaculia bacterium]
MAQAVFAFAQGCGGADIASDAFQWFVERYSAWLDSSPKKAAGRRPRDVWDKEGHGFMGRFKEIGRRAAQSGTTVGVDALSKAAQAVEGESECPFCPDI